MLHFVVILAALGTAPGAPVRTVLVARDGSPTVAQAARALRTELANDGRLRLLPGVVAPPAAVPRDGEASGRQTDLVTAALLAYNQLKPEEALAFAKRAEEELRTSLDLPYARTHLATVLRVRGLTLLYLERRDEAVTAFAAASHLAPEYTPAAAEWPPEARLLYADTGAAQQRAVAGSLSVRVQPGFASVWLDGRHVGDGSTTLADVPPGPHYLLVECPGYERFAAVVEVAGDGKLDEASVFLEPVADEAGPADAAAVLAAVWGEANEAARGRQAAAVFGVEALVWIDLESELPVAWILGADGQRRGGYVALSDPAAAAALVTARITGADGPEPLAAAAPWYMRWPTWVAAGAVVLVGGAVTTYLVAGRNEPDRMTLYLGRR